MLESKELSLTAILTAIYTLASYVPFIPLLITPMLMKSVNVKILFVSAVIGDLISSIYASPNIPLSLMLAGLSVIQQYSTIINLTENLSESKKLLKHLVILSLTFAAVIYAFKGIFLSTIRQTLENMGVEIIAEAVAIVGGAVASLFLGAVTLMIQLVILKYVAGSIGKILPLFQKRG